MATNSRIEAVERATGRSSGCAVKCIGTPTLESNVEAKEAWTEITSRFFATI